MPSPVSMMESSGILKRAIIGRDAQQGVTQNFVPISLAVPCSVQPASTGVVMLYAQRNTQVNTSVYLAQDIGAQVNDKFTTTNPAGGQKDILVRGFAQQVDRMVVWRLDGIEEPPPRRVSAASFVLTTPETTQIGVPFATVVQAVDAMGNDLSTYTGTIQFYAFSDPLAELAGPVVITGGVGTFNNILNTLGDQTILAQDVNQFSIYGTSDVIVAGETPTIGERATSSGDIRVTSNNSIRVTT